MAALVVQSRFAGLKIEDDDHPSTNVQKPKKVKTNPVKNAESSKKTKGNTNTNKSQSVPKKKKPKQPAATPDQWREWKEKDKELVEGNFETELQQAILLSKLDYEEKKDVYKKIQKAAEVEKNVVEHPKNGKKQKKKNVMSLEQLKDMLEGGEENKCNHVDEKNSCNGTKSPDKDTEFFERIKDDAKTELMKNKIIERVQNRRTESDEVITKVHFRDALEKRDKVIAELRQEIVGLKDELLTVKTRNKKLCSILGQGEMKDKAEVLMEVERMRAVQSELTAEIATLHSDLEKERSKNTDPRAKDKKKKIGSGDK